MTRRIVVHTDFTEASAAAVEYGRVLAQGLGGTLDFLHVLEGPFDAGWTAEMNPSALPEMQQAMQVEAEQWLDGVLPEDEQERFKASLRFETGDIASEILRYVHSNEVDVLIVSATTGAKTNETDTGVAEDVVRGCRCSVFVVR